MACRILMGVTVRCDNWRQFVSALDKLNEHERAVGIKGVRFWAFQSGQTGCVFLGTRNILPWPRWRRTSSAAVRPETSGAHGEPHQAHD